jgi:hypothetical protein
MILVNEALRVTTEAAWSAHATPQEYHCERNPVPFHVAEG